MYWGRKYPHLAFKRANLPVAGNGFMFTAPAAW